MPTWIDFHLTPTQPPKTQSWFVVTQGGKKEVGGIVLGTVKWWGAWRKYAFFPLAATLYEADCLRAIAAFCEEHTKARRAG